MIIDIVPSESLLDARPLLSIIYKRSELKSSHISYPTLRTEASDVEYPWKTNLATYLPRLAGCGVERNWRSVGCFLEWNPTIRARVLNVCAMREGVKGTRIQI